jgi:hypothetical protein
MYNPTTARSPELATRLLIIAFIVSAFIGGPLINVGSADIRVFDILFVTLCTLSLVWFSTSVKFPVAQLTKLYVLSVFYFSSVLFLPVFGIIIYRYPIGYLLGDFRWIQLLIVSMIIIYLYHQSVSQLISDIESGFKIILVINTAFLFMQATTWTNILEFGSILKIWYSSQPQYGTLGFHAGRFAGAHSFSSQLGLSSAVAVTFFFRSYMLRREDQVALALSLLLLIAAGSRTSIVAVGMIITSYVIFYISKRGFQTINLRGSMTMILVLIPITAIVYIGNVGRIRTSGRYDTILNILLGKVSFLQVSGRGERWQSALQAASEYQFGTLAVPSHVLRSIETIDSYFVTTYIQGGLILLGVYILFLGAVLYYALNIIYFEDYALIPIGFVVVSATHSLTQNFATGIQGKFVIVFSVVIITLVYVHHLNKSTSSNFLVHE